MPLSEFTRKLVETKLDKYCSGRIPEHSRHEVKLTYEIRENTVTLVEERRFYKAPSIWTKSAVAQFQFDDQTKKWNLYCSDRNENWYINGSVKPSADFDDLLKEVDRDPMGIFWG